MNRNDGLSREFLSEIYPAYRRGINVIGKLLDEADIGSLLFAN